MDSFLAENRFLNVSFRQDLFTSYSHLLSKPQTELFYQILTLTNNSCEFLNEIKFDPEILSHLNLFEFKNTYTSSSFIPIHHTCIEKWSPTKRINHFNFSFLKQDSENFYNKKDNKNFNYHCIPDFVFGLTDYLSGRISICQHNCIEFFQASSESLLEWFNDGISLDEASHLSFINKFPVDNSIGIQDFMLLLEIWILLRKTFKHRTRVYGSLNELLTKTKTTLRSEDWPFSKRIFTLYYFTYLYVFYFTTKSNRKKKFKYAWMEFLRQKPISSFDVDSNLVQSFKFPGKFKIRSNRSNLLVNQN